MANKNPTELIKQAANEGWTTLDLAYSQLKEMPPEITLLSELKFLDLSGNQLAWLPSDIAHMRGLIELDLSSNQLASLPMEICELTNLNSLSIASNKLKHLPPQISNLTNLTQLNVGVAGTRVRGRGYKFRGNQLSELPPQIGMLTNLELLDLEGNLLTHLTPEISKLKNLTRLDLGSNELLQLPGWIAELANLLVLGLQSNNLVSLPSDIVSLNRLKNLDLADNHLTGVPAEIVRLRKLEYFDLRGNQLPIPPVTLADPFDVKVIFAAIAGLIGGQRLNEAKMLVVGDGKVGKSSLVERLISGTFNPKKQTTLGVEIKDEMQVVQSEVQGAVEPIKLNIWDFGGQEIQHSTHQFFLTTRSLYLLVLDARKGDQIGNIEYWLKLIESFGGDSPIIVVINQIDQLKGQRELNLDRNALSVKYNIRSFISTSCETGHGISELTAAIRREVDQMKHVHDLWPPEWLAIKRRLKDMRADYIPVEKYYEICREENLNDEDLRESLLDMLHVLGTVIRFPGDTQVLNPRWVTHGVYGLLTSAQLVKDQGQFELSDVGKILDGTPETQGRYPSHTHPRLIDVMKHFQLCFEFTDRPHHYLIPRHLHDNELDIHWDESDVLKFQYQYVETLPDSIISRFIVRMNQYITKQYYWKNGVFLHDGDNRAKIKADLVDRKILISVVGKKQTRRAFLAVIRSAFEEINSSFKIQIKRMIPLPDHPLVLVSYDELLVYEKNMKSTYFVAAYGIEKDYDVSYLLEGVEDVTTRVERRQRHHKKITSPFANEEPRRRKLATTEVSNPWLSGSFYLFSFVVAIATILIAIITLNNYGISWTTGAIIPVLLIGGLLAIGIIGANQLKNDNRLSDESYVQLMIESYKRLPLLKTIKKTD